MAENESKTEPVSGYYENPRQEMLKFVPLKAKTTLEFGCGCGNFSELIKNKYDSECWGVEMNSQAAKTASEKLHRVINENAHQSLSQIPEKYFDCIIFNDVLEHMADPYSLLIGVKSKLKPSGVIIASIPNVRFWRNLKQFAVYGKWEYKDTGVLDKTHLRFFTYSSLVKMFNQLDYDLLTIEGLRPIKSIAFSIMNMCVFNRFKDAKFRQFACVARPRPSVATQKTSSLPGDNL